MKKQVLALFMAAALAVPSASVFATEAAVESTTEAANQVSADQFDTAGYLYDDGQDTYYYVAVTNLSDVYVNVKADGTAEDSTGADLGTAEAYLECLAPGETEMFQLYFPGVTGAESVSYVPVFTETDEYQSANSNLDITPICNEDNTIVAITNNADVPADFVLCYALFLDADENVIAADVQYLTDNNGWIEPGETIYGQFDCLESYETVLINTSSYLDENFQGFCEEIEVPELTHEELVEVDGNETTYYIPLYNGSDKTISIWANAVAKNKDGEIIGAQDLYVDCIGPKETSIGDFDFFNTGEIDHIEYTLHTYTEDLHLPAVSHLETAASMEGQTLTISVTNHGSMNADNVEVYAFALDADNKITCSGYSFGFDDEVYGVSAGETQSLEFTIDQSYDHIDIFLAGEAEYTDDNTAENTSDYTSNGFTRFSAKGLEQMTIDTYEKKAETNTTTTTAAATTTTTAAATTTTTTTAAPTTTTTEAPVTTTTEAEPATVTEAPEEPETVDPDFKNKMDSYVDFFRRYADYVNNYLNADEEYQAANEGDYNGWLMEAYDRWQQLQDMDTAKLSNADCAYFSDSMIKIDEYVRSTGDRFY